MKVDWPRIIRLPQTYGLLAGALAGYVGFVLWLGPRPVVWISGGGIAAVMAGGWVSSFRRQAISQSPSDLLVTAVFEQQMNTIEAKVPNRAEAVWRQTRQWARESQVFAAQIAQQDPLLQVELLEATHTVLGLAQQVADALQVLGKIQTSAYQQMAQQRLQTSCDRLQETHQRLKQLQDQVALASLDAETAAFPNRLHQLIEANQQILKSTSIDNDKA
ncbi:MAG: hypothetical protein QNJ46_26175 [Leptolyngbyaceae cyanobacterium MO_188.B28]|nr:hypothetical protein [Leptolyngbyaceae cyanobacterium MO_188.B28]